MAHLSWLLLITVLLSYSWKIKKETIVLRVANICSCLSRLLITSVQIILWELRTFCKIINQFIVLLMVVFVTFYWSTFQNLYFITFTWVFKYPCLYLYTECEDTSVNRNIRVAHSVDSHPENENNRIPPRWENTRMLCFVTLQQLCSWSYHEVHQHQHENRGGNNILSLSLTSVR